MEFFVSTSAHGRCAGRISLSARYIRHTMNLARVWRGSVFIAAPNPRVRPIWAGWQSVDATEPQCCTEATSVPKFGRICPRRKRDERKARRAAPRSHLSRGVLGAQASGGRWARRSRVVRTGVFGSATETLATRLAVSIRRVGDVRRTVKAPRPAASCAPRGT